MSLPGLPSAFAPSPQTGVPLVRRLEPGRPARHGVGLDCLHRHAGQALSHDHVFHTVLGLMDVQTRVYRPELDAMSPCSAG